MRSSAQALWGLAVRPLFLTLCFLILAAIGAASIVLVIVSQSDAERVDHSLRVENRLVNLMYQSRSTNSGQRGYLLTGNRGYLNDYQGAIAAVVSEIAALKAATADNPLQQERIAALETVVMRKIDKLRESVRLYDAGDLSAALAVMAAGSDQSRTLLAADLVTKEEERLLGLRILKAGETKRLLLAVNLTGTALIIGLAVLSLMAARRMVLASERRSDELQSAIGELEAFSYGVSHDLRAPLRAIDAFSRILLTQYGPELSDEPREYLQLVRDNTVQRDAWWTTC